MSEFYLSAGTRQQLQNTADALELAPEALILLLLSQQQLWAEMSVAELDPAFQSACQTGLNTHPSVFKQVLD